MGTSEAERGSRALAQLFELTSALSATADITESYNLALDCLRRALGVGRCAVLERNEEGVPRVCAWRGLSADFRAAAESFGCCLPDGPDACPLFAPDAARESRLQPVREALRCEGVASLAVIPMREDGAGGALLVCYQARHTFTADERLLLGIVARQLGTARQRAHAQRDAELARRRAEFLVRAGEQLAASLQHGDTLATVARLAIPEIADCCVVELADVVDDARRLTISHAESDKAELARDLYRRYPPEPGAPHDSSRVLATGRPELYPEIGDDLLVAGARDEEHLALLRALQPRSALVVPMHVRGRTLGTITFIASRPQLRYGQADLEVAMSLAQRAALAVDNARLYAHAQRAVQARENLLATVSHDLRNPLGVCAW